MSVDLHILVQTTCHHGECESTLVGPLLLHMSQVDASKEDSILRRRSVQVLLRSTGW